MVGVAVGGQPGGEEKTGLAARNDIQHTGPRDAPGPVGPRRRPVTRKTGKRRPAANPTDTAGLRWQPEMWPDSVSHCQDSQAEGQRHAQQSDANLGECGRQHGGAAPSEY